MDFTVGCCTFEISPMDHCINSLLNREEYWLMCICHGHLLIGPCLPHISVVYEVM